jgi:hypothetical protein
MAFKRGFLLADASQRSDVLRPSLDTVSSSYTLLVATITSSTLTTPVTSHPGVLFGVLMAMCAMSTTSELSGQGVASIEILSQRHWFEMLRITTPTISAQVIQNEVIRNGTYQQSVCNSMCSEVLVQALHAEGAVAIRSGGFPFPTLGCISNIHLLPEAHLVGFGQFNRNTPSHDKEPI